MKIGVIGAGALGGFFGSLLTESGHDVTLIDVRRDLVDFIGVHGIKISYPTGEEKRIEVKASVDPDVIGVVDLIFLAIKSYDTVNAITSTRNIIGESTSVMSIQNGAGNLEAIASIIGREDNVIGGTFFHGVTVLAPGHLKYVPTIGGISIGPFSGELTERIYAIGDVFKGIGYEVKVYENAQDLVWNKLLNNACINAIAAVTGLETNYLLDFAELKELMKHVGEETVSVMKAKGISLNYPEEPLYPVFDALKKVKASKNINRVSMLQDVEAGRLTEIDAINGMVVSEGQKHRIPTPYNRALVLLMKAIERKKDVQKKE